MRIGPIISLSVMHAITMVARLLAHFWFGNSIAICAASAREIPAWGTKPAHAHRAAAGDRPVILAAIVAPDQIPARRTPDTAKTTPQLATSAAKLRCAPETAKKTQQTARKSRRAVAKNAAVATGAILRAVYPSVRAVMSGATPIVRQRIATKIAVTSTTAVMRRSIRPSAQRRGNASAAPTPMLPARCSAIQCQA